MGSNLKVHKKFKIRFTGKDMRKSRSRIERLLPFGSEFMGKAIKRIRLG